MPFNVTVGDTVELITGCNRTRAACRTKFSNLVHFQGEPDIPGTDRLLRIGRGV